MAEETNWDQKGYDWYATGRPVPYRIGDGIVVFDDARGWAMIVQVDDSVTTATRTPDGRHFVAFRPVPRMSRRRLTPSLYATLKASGMIRGKGDAMRGCRISRGMWEDVLGRYRRR